MHLSVLEFECVCTALRCGRLYLDEDDLVALQSTLGASASGSAPSSASASLLPCQILARSSRPLARLAFLLALVPVFFARPLSRRRYIHPLLLQPRQYLLSLLHLKFISEAICGLGDIFFQVSVRLTAGSFHDVPRPIIMKLMESSIHRVSARAEAVDGVWQSFGKYGAQ
ncbi:hypothetical protein CY34DRAFT_17818 [Suillus luteus UH-Slu-Lm8-n1]|uniref:Uncharacterized protein n=1 Tax=Suillus luteus UH-Slu-Lm8-n1 TaxID=930992 RepID=A0A0C9ZXT5_9AGAM|nr:hypothetical protein CY34DRAFT_17818 [Suillus luteus UH-Slu-Lm8-n1]